MILTELILSTKKFILFSKTKKAHPGENISLRIFMIFFLIIIDLYYKSVRFDVFIVLLLILVLFKFV